MKMFKAISLTISAAVIATSLVGCGSTTTTSNSSKQTKQEPKSQATTTSSEQKQKSPSLKEIALKEKDWLAKLDQIVKQIRSDYAQWENGNITKEQLTKKLLVQKQKVKELRDQEEQYYLSFTLPDEIKNNKDYYKGLYYGYSLRLNVFSFLTYATDSVKPLTDTELKDMYQTEMETGFNRKLGLIEPAIDKLTK